MQDLRRAQPGCFLQQCRISKGAGEDVGLSFSLLYAAPETVAAFTGGKASVVADTAVDIFAFGIICYEVLTRQPYYMKGLTGSDVGDMLAGLQPLPHEQMLPTTERALGSLKRYALQLLAQFAQFCTWLAQSCNCHREH